MDRQALRDRMAALPFAPIDSDLDSRNAHALGYIAFYLSAIEQHLGTIAGSLSQPRGDEAPLVAALKSVAAALQTQPPLAAAVAPELFLASAPKEPPRAVVRYPVAHHHAMPRENQVEG